MLWKQGLEKIESKLVGNILSAGPGGGQRSLALHAEDEHALQGITGMFSHFCLYKRIRDAWAVTFPKLLTQTVYYEQYLIYLTHLKPSEFAPAWLLECKGIICCCRISARSNHCVEE